MGRVSPAHSKVTCGRRLGRTRICHRVQVWRVGVCARTWSCTLACAECNVAPGGDRITRPRLGAPSLLGPIRGGRRHSIASSDSPREAGGLRRATSAAGRPSRDPSRHATPLPRPRPVRRLPGALHLAGPHLVGRAAIVRDVSAEHSFGTGCRGALAPVRPSTAWPAVPAHRECCCTSERARAGAPLIAMAIKSRAAPWPPVPLASAASPAGRRVADCAGFGRPSHLTGRAANWRRREAARRTDQTRSQIEKSAARSLPAGIVQMARHFHT